MPRSVRLAPIGLALAIAAALGPATAALAFSKTDTEKPVEAGRGYVYYIREVDANKNPLAGRTVVMSVGTVPAADATVAASDAAGHVSGTPGRTANEQSGADGMVYFVLRTSATPGQNQFTWSDTAYTGQVLVTGTAPASPSAKPGAAAGTAKGGAAPRASVAGSHGFVVPPPAAGIAASALVWLGGPALLVRRRRRAVSEEPMPSLSDRLPISG